MLPLPHWVHLKYYQLHRYLSFGCRRTRVNKEHCIKPCVGMEHIRIQSGRHKRLHMAREYSSSYKLDAYTCSGDRNVPGSIATSCIGFVLRNLSTYVRAVTFKSIEGCKSGSTSGITFIWCIRSIWRGQKF